MSQAQKPQIPDPLRTDAITAQVIREILWRPAARKDDWRVFVVVGREGSGKSLTCASILQMVDPQFDVDSVHFDPVHFLRDVSKETDRPGVAVMSDESGVGFGNRTWHDRAQVESNQALQTARDYNRIVGLTIPRLEELDSQFRGRIHVILETTTKKDGDYVDVKLKVVDPSRTGEGKIYKKYPRVHVNGRRNKVTRLRIGPPASDFVDVYQQKKADWKQSLFNRVIGRYEEEAEDEKTGRTPAEIVESIIDDELVDDYTASYNGRTYIDDDLIYADFEVSVREAKRVKKMLEREVELDA